DVARATGRLRRRLSSLVREGRSGTGAPGETRTHGLQVRNLTLYPLSYGRARNGVAEREGFEPSEQVTPLNGLANRRTRPLCDLSGPTAVRNPSTGPWRGRDA